MSPMKRNQRGLEADETSFNTFPLMPTKYGIKIFATVDSVVFYTCNMEIYVNKQPEGPFKDSNEPMDVVQHF